MYLDLAWFDPKRFGNKEPLPPKALDKIVEILPGLDKGKLVEEITSFAEVWPRISNKTISDEYQEEDLTERDLSDDDFDEEESPTFQQMCIRDSCVHSKTVNLLLNIKILTLLLIIIAIKIAFHKQLVIIMMTIIKNQTLNRENNFCLVQ